jgi:hypothetical protein
MKRSIISVMALVVLVATMAIPVLADTGTPGFAMPQIGTHFGNALQVLWSNIIDLIVIVLPAGLAIMGMSIAIGLGKKFIRMFAK